MPVRLFAVPLLVGATALLLALPAQGQATYELALSGQVVHTVNCWEDVPLCDGPPSITLPWSGTLTVVLDTGADGSYANGRFESLSLVADWASFSISPADDSGSVEVTVVGGRVASFDAYFPVTTAKDVSAFYSLSGLTVTFDGSGNTHYGDTIATGTLASVPEPPAAWLLLAALGFAAATRGRRAQACASGQRGFTSNA